MHMMDTAGFAIDLYGALRRAEDNLFFSPFSIGQAIDMVLLGARGDTHAEIAAMLIPAGAAGLRVPPAASETAVFQCANALWAAADIGIEPAFAEDVAREFGGLVASVDFADERRTRDRINSWVAAQTEGRIRELIGRDAATSLARLILTNAVHFKAGWAMPFPKGGTERRRFHRTGREDVVVSMMRVTGAFRLSVQDGVKVLTIPYRGGRASMIVILPDEADGLEAAEARLSAELLDGWLAASEIARVDLILPRFETGSALALRDVLSTLGMRRAFDPASADLRGITPQPGFVGDVIHRSFVQVDEAGTEAAAATAVLMPRGRPSAEPVVPFVVDRPFLYLIHAEEGRRILFMGRLTDPAATAC